MLADILLIGSGSYSLLAVEVTTSGSVRGLCLDKLLRALGKLLPCHQQSRVDVYSRLELAQRSLEACCAFFDLFTICVLLLLLKELVSLH